MKTDIRGIDDAKSYRLAVDLPGFKKEEISLDLKDGYLAISAEKGLDKNEEDKKTHIGVQKIVIAHPEYWVVDMSLEPKGNWSQITMSL